MQWISDNSSGLRVKMRRRGDIDSEALINRLTKPAAVSHGKMF